MSKLRGIKKRDTKGSRIDTHQGVQDVYFKQTPLFSLQFLKVNKYCPKDCEPSERAIFFDALYKRSCLTWEQIRQISHETLGYEILKNEKINDNLRKNAKMELAPDAPIKIFRAKKDTKMRIVGHREGRIFYLLYLDRKGDLYSHD